MSVLDAATVRAAVGRGRDLDADLDRVSVDDRHRRLAARLAVRELDALWIDHAPDVRWVSGFTGSAGTVLATRAGGWLITDGRYAEQAAEQLAAVDAPYELLVAGPAERDRVLADAVGAIEAAEGAPHVGFDPDRLSVAAHGRLGGILADIGAELEAEAGVVGTLRRRKDVAEIQRLARAAAITDAVLHPLLVELTAPTGERASERAMARRLADAMIDLGADDVSFDLIVAGGPNGSRPHARPGSRVPLEGELVTFDVGAKVDGYGSDMTRTVAVGGTTTETRRRWYDAVIEAQAAGVAAVAAGVDEVLIDAACRDVLEAHGLAEFFTHGTGHGLGLEIHEAPILSTRSVGILSAGLAVTVEPGVYLPGEGGVRIEDAVVVTDDGAIPLTATPKGLRVV